MISAFVKNGTHLVCIKKKGDKTITLFSVFQLNYLIKLT